MAITLRTDKAGLSIIDRARADKNWTALALAWCTEANVSVSTLKRFRERKAIQKEAFIAICRAVGIEDWQRIVGEPVGDASVLRQSYRRSKRLIAEEVISNLKSLDARLDFVEQAFSDWPSDECEPGQCEECVSDQDCAASIKSMQRTLSQQGRDLRHLFSHQSLRMEANVSIIQIMMEVEP
ncbi:MAG: hypothetical protein AAFY72_08455 [Cyanobacteria bacterium J06649_4]